MPERRSRIANIHEAKTELSQLISQALAGDKVVIARAGKPEIQLVPIRKKERSRSPGSARGTVWISGDFDAPLPAGILEAFQS